MPRLKGKAEDLKATACGSVAGSRAAGALEEDLWLCPIEDRRREGSQREGLSREAASILDRLGTSAEV